MPVQVEKLPHPLCELRLRPIELPPRCHATMIAPIADSLGSSSYSQVAVAVIAPAGGAGAAYAVTQSGRST